MKNTRFQGLILFTFLIYSAPLFAYSAQDEQCLLGQFSDIDMTHHNFMSNGLTNTNLSFLQTQKSHYSLLVPIISPQAIPEDIIHTKDGGMYRGRIVEEYPNEKIVIEDRAGNRHVIVWDNIARIERGVAAIAPRHSQKSATVSWALSFFLWPGLGQFYNGDSSEGAGMAATAFFGLIMLVSENEDRSLLGALIYLGTWVYSWIEAPARSMEINREAGFAALNQRSIYANRYNHVMGWDSRFYTQRDSMTILRMNISF